MHQAADTGDTGDTGEVIVDLARRAVQATCAHMVADAMVVGSAGNVSVRVDQHRFVVSAGGVAYHRLHPGDHPLVDLRTGTWTGPLAPTSELHLHLALMRARPDVGAVVHTHSPYAAGFSVARLDLEWVCNENIGPRGERILVTSPYAPPGSNDLAIAAVAALDAQPGSRACLLANHGPLAIGDDVDEAYLIARQVEWIAHITHVARSVGTVHVLSAPEQDAIGINYGFAVARPKPRADRTVAAART